MPTDSSRLGTQLELQRAVYEARIAHIAKDVIAKAEARKTLFAAHLATIPEAVVQQTPGFVVRDGKLVPADSKKDT